MDYPDFSLEQALGGPIAGIDEVGYGAWAGPVVTAAVILYPTQIPSEILGRIRDSKALSAAQRTQLYTLFMAQPTWMEAALTFASVEDITTHNVLQATQRAMVQAVQALTTRPTHILVDGPRKLPIDIPQTPLIKGDQRSLSIALASILAKVTRDQWMCQLSPAYPAFLWHQNKGYGTQAHQRALQLHGLTPHHRASYRITQYCSV